MLATALMRPDCASNATRTVLDALSKLAAPDLLNTSELEASLLPSERCFLRNAGLHDAAGQLPSCNAADNNSRVISCWHMDWGDCSKRPLQTGREAPSRKYGGEGPWLPYASRYASLAAGAPESSHFAVAAHLAGLPAKSLLQGDGRLNGLRTLFVGDSLANQLQSAAACELGRALSSRLHGRAPSAAATLIEMHDFRPNMTVHGNGTQRLASVDAAAISRLHNLTTMPLLEAPSLSACGPVSTTLHPQATQTSAPTIYSKPDRFWPRSTDSPLPVRDV